MENKVRNSHGAEIPRKSRSLDIKSLYKADKTNSKKRKRSGEGEGERKKSRKVGNSRKSLEEVYSGGGFSSGSNDSKGLSGLLEDGIVKVPRRKRDFVRRKKVENGGELLGQLNGGVKDVDEIRGVSGKEIEKRIQSSNDKQEGAVDDSKENGNGQLNSGRHLEDVDGLGVCSALNNSDLSLNTCHMGHSVEPNGDASLKKSLRKRSRKRKDLASESKSIVKEAVPSVDVSFRTTDALEDEYGENLEEKIIQSSKGKQEGRLDDSKESINCHSNSGRHLADVDGQAGCSALNSCDLCLNMSHTCHSIEHNGDAPLNKLSKSLRKRSRKRKDLASDSKSAVNKAVSSVDVSVKTVDALEDEDEKNLEENAAMMLSLRFDPRCTGFSSNSKASSLPPTNGLSFPLSLGQEIVHLNSNDASGSDSASVDTAGRVLRPRKQLKVRGGTRKRRHFYEIFAGNLDAYWVLNRRIKVFWPLDESWYYGLVDDYDEERRLHHVKYDDRDEEWINLQDERFKLLLLPTEVQDKHRRRRSRSVVKVKRLDGEKGKIKSRKEKKGDLTREDDGYAGNYVDSEPIISWLARSTRRVKSPPLHAFKKQRTSVVSSFSENAISRLESLDAKSLNEGRSMLSPYSSIPEKLGSTGRAERSAVESPTCSQGSRLPIVYYRRRFRKRHNIVDCAPEIPESVIVASGALEECDLSVGRLYTEGALERQNTVEALWLTDDTGLLKLNVSLVESRQLRFELSIPVIAVCNCSFSSESVWLSRDLLLHEYGTLITLWPRVQLEMLFVDNVVGLRFLLFEGYLEWAVALVFSVLSLLHQPNEQGKYADLQLPVTSIRFKFSCTEDYRKHLVFAFYKFSEVEDSKWMYLECKLRRHCLFTRKLPLSQCTYDNIKALQNGANLLLGSSVRGDSTTFKVPQEKSRKCSSLMSVSRESLYINASRSSDFHKNHRHYPLFQLSFNAAPTFFLGLHLKLLMEHSMTHISFPDRHLIDQTENSSNLIADEFSSLESCSKSSEISDDSNMKASSTNIGGDGCFAVSESGQLAIDASACDNMKPFPGDQNAEQGVKISTSLKDHGNLETDTIIPLQTSHHTEPDQCGLLSRSSVGSNKENTGSISLTVEIPEFNQLNKHVDQELQVAQQSMDLTWNMNRGIIPSPNPTARRTTWLRSKNSSSSFAYRVNGWLDGRLDLQNNFGNGPKKPRTQVSYALPFGSSDHSPKTRGHQQKGLPHKRIRTPNEKRLADVSRGPERCLEFLSCDANVLVTLGDRGWRESGAQVVLELFDHNEWKLAVKLAGVTKYSYKAHQFLQPGSTNRFSHAMMWKGGKDWMLEFPDRSQWALFKELHEECYNRNVRAASVKNIPIPGVRLIEENEDNGIEMPFVRTASKYFRQLETDVEMASNPSRVLYDMDSEDEQWLLEKQRPSVVGNGCLWGISEDMFEKVVDMFEKAAYSEQCDHVTSDKLQELVAGFGSMEAVKTIYEYWQQKRQKKGMPLIRHLQPPLWQRYQQEVKEWELSRNKSNTALPNGCHEKTAPEEKPPMFAFCLKPRGLEVPNKGSKQRSHRKSSVAGQSYTLAGDHDGFHSCGRRLNGIAPTDVHPGYNYDSLEDSPLPQVSPCIFSPRDVGTPGCSSMSSDGYDRNLLQKSHRSKPKRLGFSVSPNGTQVVSSCDQNMFDKRNGFGKKNMGFSDWPSSHHYHLDRSLRGPEWFDGADLDELRLRDASDNAKYKVYMAKLKRERAQKLLFMSDNSIHRAMAALMTAEAIKGSLEDSNGDM